MSVATRILLTGGTGFLGTALARYWLVQGHTISILSRSDAVPERLADISHSLAMIKFDSHSEIVAAVQSFKPEVIVHTACDYGRNGGPIRHLVDANVGMGLSLIDAVLNSSLSQVCFMNAGTVLDASTNHYALSKAQFSEWGRAISNDKPGQLTFADLRLQQIYGPGDDQTKFTTYIIRSCRNNIARLPLTAGEQMRDFIHVDDVVRAFDTILGARHDLASYEQIDIGSGEAVRICDFAKLAKQLTEADTVLDFGAVPYRRNEAMFCEANTDRLRQMGWSPVYGDLRSGLRQMLDADVKTYSETQKVKTA